jgi:predicted nuclease of predicted toxin-antitoxin system
LDNDFGELTVLRGMAHCAHCGILRLVNLSAHQQAIVCLQVLAGHEAELGAGAILTAEAGRLRIRLP